MSNNNDSTQDRTEEATPRRRQEAKEKGQVARSRDLMSALVSIAGAGGLLVFGGRILHGFKEVMHMGFSPPTAAAFDVNTMLAQVAGIEKVMMAAVFPWFLLIMAAALLSGISVGGLSFSWQSLSFKGERLSFTKGLKRIFALKGLVELCKTLLKFLLVTAVAIMILWLNIEKILVLGTQPLYIALSLAAEILGWSLLGIASTLILIAAIDVPFQLWQHSQQLKMTKQEVKEEYKKTEGSPETKRRVRQVQYEMAQRRMMAEVPNADVVITNPTHVAVALRYNDAEREAPYVVAKGPDLIAAKIREIAYASDVQVVEIPVLARAIYHTTDLGKEIPAGLYVAVAKVLAYVFQLRRYMVGKAKKPKPPKKDDMPIPNEYKKWDRS